MCLNDDLRNLNGTPLLLGNDSVTRALTDDACDECALKAIHVELRRRERDARGACQEGAQLAAQRKLTANLAWRVVWYCLMYVEACLSLAPECEGLHWMREVSDMRATMRDWTQTARELDPAPVYAPNLAAPLTIVAVDGTNRVK